MAKRNAWVTPVLQGVGFNVLTISVAVAALLVSGAGAYYARRAIFPPARRLVIYIPPASSLIATSGALPEFSVSYGGKELQRPYVTQVTVSNTGRHAITSEMFDNKRPIELDFHAPIVAVSSSGAVPEEFARVRHVESSTILIGPELVQPGASMSFHVVTEGAPKPLQPIHFIVGTEVAIRREGEADVVSYRLLRSTLVFATAAGLSSLINLLSDYIK
jgi:hypothetical protein